MNTINKKSSGVFKKLKRTGSDTTVYTGFSGDYLQPPEAGIRKIPVLATSASSGSSPISPVPRPFHPPHMFHHHHHHHGPHHRHHHHGPPPYRRVAHARPYPLKPPSKIRFNGLNYVNGSASSSSYRDWKMHQHYYHHNHNHHHRHHRHHFHHGDGEEPIYQSEEPPLIKEMTQSEEEEEEDSTLGNDVTIIQGEPSRLSEASSNSLKKYNSSKNTHKSATFAQQTHLHNNNSINNTNNRKNIRLNTEANSRGILSHKTTSSHQRPVSHHPHMHHHHHGRHTGRHDHVHIHRPHSPTDGMILTPSGLYHY